MRSWQRSSRTEGSFSNGLCNDQGAAGSDERRSQRYSRASRAVGHEILFVQLLNSSFDDGLVHIRCRDSNHRSPILCLRRERVKFGRAVEQARRSRSSASGSAIVRPHLHHTTITPLDTFQLSPCGGAQDARFGNTAVGLVERVEPGAVFRSSSSSRSHGKKGFLGAMRTRGRRITSSRQGNPRVRNRLDLCAFLPPHQPCSTLFASRIAGPSSSLLRVSWCRSHRHAPQARRSRRSPSQYGPYGHTDIADHVGLSAELAADVWQWIRMNGQVSALTVFDDGSGPALYAGGAFTTAGGVVVNGIAKWNGSSWSQLGSGMSGSFSRQSVLSQCSTTAVDPRYTRAATSRRGWCRGEPHCEVERIELVSARKRGEQLCLCPETFNAGSGPALYAGGSYRSRVVSFANGIAKWNGSSWSALGSALTAPSRPWRSSTMAVDPRSTLAARSRLREVPRGITSRSGTGRAGPRWGAE